jgi:hypothetical protein
MINSDQTKELVNSLYDDKWLNLVECEALTGLSRRLLKERCKKRLIEHQNYGGRGGYKVQWRKLKSYIDSHTVPVGGGEG